MNSIKVTGIVFILIFFTSTLLFSQNSILDTKINLIVKNERIGDVLFKLGNTANVDFSYNPDVISLDKRITLTATNRSLISILKEIAPGKNYEFKVYGRQIQIIKRLPKKDEVTIVKSTSAKSDTKATPVAKITVQPKNETSKKQIEEPEISKTKNQVPVANDGVYEKKDSSYSIQDYVPINVLSQETTIADTLLKVTELPDKPTEEKEINNKKEQKKLNRKPLPLSVMLMYSPLYPFMHLQSIVNNVPVERIKEFEKPKLSYTVNAFVQYNVKHFFIQSGIGISSFKQKTDYNFNHIDSNYFPVIHQISYYTLFKVDSFYVVKNIKDTTWKYIIDSTLKIKYDTLLHLKLDTLVKTSASQNSFTYIEIPLIAGYQWHSKRNTFTISTGLITGILHKSAGVTLSATNSEEFIEINTLPITKTIFSYYLAIGFQYHLTNHFAMGIETNFRQFINSAYSSNYVINQRFSSIGINISIHYFFNKIQIK